MNFYLFYHYLQYPFLEDVWDIYKKFDNTMEYDNNKYDVICDTYVLQNSDEDIRKYSQFCKKLMKNLGYHSIYSSDYELSSYRCNILFHWIYNFLDKGKITYNIIDKCFDLYDFEMKGKENLKRCYYYPEIKFYKPMNITLLQIFESKMNIIKDILNGQDKESKIPSQKFVCECLKIYKHMNKTYCLERREQSKMHKDTCYKLDVFSNAYKIFYDMLLGTNHKIPSLDDINSKDFPKCLSDEEKTEEGSEVRQAEVPQQVAGIGQERQSEGTSRVAEQSDTGTSLNTFTVLSSMVGIPPFLALIYKFTPVGTMLRSKNRRSVNIYNNLDDEIEKELFYPSNKNAIINSSLQRYNVGYGSV
ncbi:hypothetical protein PVBG_05944 [Plasmodium vivax Brazil I]|uniref:VIR protein n=1 Tax=Plasmodium vivax (strain Brazil I) TaxID=1033975 RepID=A0A0J9SN72_PLAV1|nr:hypothetical protein PVBG_05944 [Plasmodium vivax Brazil I]